MRNVIQSTISVLPKMTAIPKMKCISWIWSIWFSRDYPRFSFYLLTAYFMHVWILSDSECIQLNSKMNWNINRENIFIERKKSIEYSNVAFCTYRPCKIEWKPYWIDKAYVRCMLRQIHAILAKHRCYHITKCARRCQIDFCLIIFQAYAKPRPTRAHTLSEFVGLLAAAFANAVFAIVIFKILQSQFK